MHRITQISTCERSAYNLRAWGLAGHEVDFQTNEGGSHECNRDQEK